MYLNKIIVTIIGLTAYAVGFAQNPLSMNEAVQKALLHNPQMKASGLRKEQNNFLEKAAFDLTNPEVTLESPTGEFLTVGVMQSFSFPTVYSKQKDIAKQTTALSATAEIISKNDVTQQVQRAYLEVQYFTKLSTLLQLHDSIYSEMEKAAIRQFDAGSIDATARAFTQMKRAAAARELSNAIAQRNTAALALQILIGVSDNFITDEMNELTTEIPLVYRMTDSTLSTPSTFLQYAKQNKEIAVSLLSLEKQKALPGLAIGYMNQGARDTPNNLRLRAGITIPLWWWQYKGKINAAKTEVKIAEQQMFEQEQKLNMLLNAQFSSYLNYKQALTYFNHTGLSIGAALISDSQRMFAAGSIDYTEHFRNLEVAFEENMTYYETLFNLNQTVIQLNYITAQ